MKLESPSISFKSNIKLISQREFYQKVRGLNKALHEVDYPWTPDTIKVGKNLFTVGIKNCIAGGVTDGKTAAMFHQAHWDSETAKKFSKKIFNADELEKVLLEKIDLTGKKLHGFILGGIKAQEKEEIWLLQAITKIFKKNKIPYSEITGQKETKYYRAYSLFYENTDDILYITTNAFESKVSDTVNKETFIKNGTVFYSLREKVENGYNLKLCEGTAEDYLNSQFDRVKLSKFDKIV